MPSFSQMRDYYRLQREAKRVKKELKNIHIEADAQGVHVVVNAEQEILEIVIAPDVPQEKIPSLLKDALNRALGKAQTVAAQHMQGVMGEMGLPTGQ